MGISGLYKFLEECVHESHLNALRGKTVAIDMPCWIHRAAISDAPNIAMGINHQKSYEMINQFIQKRLQMLTSRDIKAICVFDGQKLPAKLATNEKRRSGRDEALKKAREALAAGEDWKARNYFCQAIKISPEINQSVKKFCASKNLKVITAPYEADAQLAYLSRKKLVSAVISEDSDLVIFGIENLVTKLDDNGACKLVQTADLNRVEGLRPFGKDKLLWLRYACLLQGCDYYPSGLAGIGLKTAVKMLQKAKEDGKFLFEDVLKSRHKYTSKKMAEKWSNEDLRGVTLAEQCFRYQLILNIKSGEIEPLEPYPLGKEESDYKHCGAKDDHDVNNMTLSRINIEVVEEKPKSQKPIPMKVVPVKREAENRKRTRDDETKPVAKRPSIGPMKPEVIESVLSEESSSGSELEFEKKVKREATREKITGKKPTIKVVSQRPQVRSQYWRNLEDSSSDEEVFGSPKKKTAAQEQKKSVFDKMESAHKPAPSSFDLVFDQKSSDKENKSSQNSQSSQDSKSPIIGRVTPAAKKPSSQKLRKPSKSSQPDQKQSKISSFFVKK